MSELAERVHKLMLRSGFQDRAAQQTLLEAYKALASRPSPEWQPIETAPKNQDIWACDPDRGYAARVRIVIGNEAECIDYQGRRMGIGFYPKFWRDMPPLGLVSAVEQSVAPSSNG